jgi:hypothetical protein
VVENAVGYVRLQPNRRYEQRGPDQAVLVHIRHRYGILSSRARSEGRAQLGEAGFAPGAEVYGRDQGGPTDDATAGTDRYVHLIARKPLPEPAPPAAPPGRRL